MEVNLHSTEPFSPDVPLANLVAVVPMPIAFVDREYRFTFANGAAAMQLGTSKAELEGSTLEEIFPDTWPTLKVLVDSVLEGRPAFNLDLNLKMEDGEKQHEWLTSLYPVREEGEITAVVGMSTDVTKLRDTERALEIRNDLFAMLARVNAAVSSSASKQELFDEICEIAYRTGNFRYAWVGVPKDGSIIPVAHAGDDKGRMAKLAEDNLMISTDPSDPRSLCPTGQAFLTGEISYVNNYFETPETAPWREAAAAVGFYASAGVPIRQQGEVVAVLTLYAQRENFFTEDMIDTLREITPSLSLALDRFELEHRRRVSEEALGLREEALMASTQGVSINDVRAEGSPIIYASPALEELFGYTPEEIVGKSSQFFTARNSDTEVWERMGKGIAEGRSVEGEVLCKRKDGGTFWCRIRVSPIKDEDGEITHVVAVSTDISDQRKLENQVRQTQKMEAIGQLAGGVAHDFNNALTAIRGSVDLAISETDRDIAIEDLKQADKAAEHATHLTRQLLAFSRQQVLQPQSTDLNGVVTETAELVTRIIGDNIALRPKLDPEVAAVLVDRAQLQQVIINLSINARDAMPDGGTISITTANIFLDQSCVEHGFIPKAGSYAVVEITDSGHGMDEETQSKLFDPFFTTKTDGTGLGLATVYGIITQTGGHIAVESAVGVGTTFKIYLPTTSLEVAPERVDPVAGTGRLSGTETILHVEDSEMLRPIVRRSLSRHGYSVLSAASAEEALTIAESLDGKLDLVITDVMMPGLNGRELAERLLKKYPNLRVLFTSGYPADMVLRKGIAEAEISYLEKPFLSKDLLTLVRSMLDAG